jgi:hypothetical protein
MHSSKNLNTCRFNVIYDFGSWTRKSENLQYNAPFLNLRVAYQWQDVTVGWLWRKVSEIQTHVNIKPAEFKQITKRQQTSGVFHLLLTYIFKSVTIFQERYFKKPALKCLPSHVSYNTLIIFET